MFRRTVLKSAPEMLRRSHLRWLVLALLVCVAGLLSAQAAHLHPDAHQHQCQLCSTPHLAFSPAQHAPTLAPQLVSEHLSLAAEPHFAPALLTFSLSIRPPPSR